MEGVVPRTALLYNNLTTSWENESIDRQNPGVHELIMRALPLLDGLPENGISMEVIGGIGL